MAAAAVDAVVEEVVVDTAVVVEAMEAVALSLAEAVTLDTDFSHTIVVLAL
jgi:hypothetical protein